MSRTAAVTLALALLASTAALAGEKVTLKGEVIDTACYLAHEAQGAEHASCAASCIRKGMPAGLLLPDGNVYVLLGAEHDALNAKLADVAAQQIEATGEVSEAPGLRALFVEEWHVADGSKAPAPAATTQHEHGHGDTQHHH